MEAIVYQMAAYRPAATPPRPCDRAASVAATAAMFVEMGLPLSEFTNLRPAYRAELATAIAALERVEAASVTLIRAASQ